MKEFNNTNPWLGLRTYSENSESEGHYLYGRASEIDSLSRDISYNRQTVVYGKSGIGKSSLLNAGVFPRLRKANMFPVNVRLVHKGEGSTYSTQISTAVEDSLYHLRREIINEDGKVAIIKDLRGRKVETCPPVNADGTETLWEYFHRHRFFDEQNNEIVPVLVIDQFEEIFTLCKDETKKLSFFSELADLINDVPPAYIFNIQETLDKNNIVEELTIDGNEDLILSEDEDPENNNQSKYVNDPQFHLVITLREDFLSYLERYTTNIPLLKHNRYCLKPLSDDQAAEIILDPVPGLISKEVAVDIICKVANAKRGDFVLGDGIAQIEVDSAILSLFLSELFVHRSNTNSIISKELVESIGDNIIKSFYERTISKISEKSALFLEKELITDDGEFARRDSIFESVAVKNGVTAEELDYLKEERLIHEYLWNNDIRIEFIHDILCPVIKERKEKRAQYTKVIKEREKYEEKIKAQQKRYKLLSFLFAFLVIFFLAAGVYLFNKSNQVSVCIQVKESEDIKDNDFWRAKLIVVCGNDTLCKDTVDKVRTNVSFVVGSTKYIQNLQCTLIPLVGNIQQSVTSFSAADSSNVVIDLKPNAKTKALFGKIHVSSGSIQPVMGAIVIWGSQVVKTSRTGYFCFNEPTDLQFNKDAYKNIKIIKEGYVMTERSIKDNGSIYTIDLENKDSFYKQCKEYEQLDTTKYRKITFEGDYRITKSLGTLVVNTYFIDNSTIEGYYYYKKAIEKCRNRKETSYILFNGKIVGKDKIVITATDDAYNKRTIVAELRDKNNTIQGEAFSSEKMYDFKLCCKNDIKEIAEKALGHQIK